LSYGAAFDFKVNKMADNIKFHKNTLEITSIGCHDRDYQVDTQTERKWRNRKESHELRNDHYAFLRSIQMDQYFSRSCSCTAHTLNTSHIYDSLICTTCFIYYL
jgi:hypothetical protein